jgi:hypothetical protein
MCTDNARWLNFEMPPDTKSGQITNCKVHYKCN